VDEAYQASVPGRHGSVRDVALDSLGAVAIVIVVRSRKQVTDGDTAARDTSGTRLTTEHT
jgi:VanZ family protein